MAALYSETSLQILDARSYGSPNTQSCDLSKINVTEYLATIPDAPVMKTFGSDKLVQVTIGRGVQVRHSHCCYYFTSNSSFRTTHVQTISQRPNLSKSVLLQIFTMCRALLSTIPGF